MLLPPEALGAPTPRLQAIPPDIYCGRLVDFRLQAKSVSPSSPFLFLLSAAREKFPVRKLQRELPRQTLDCSVVLSQYCRSFS